MPKSSNVENPSKKPRIDDVNKVATTVSKTASVSSVHCDVTDTTVTPSTSTATLTDGDMDTTGPVDPKRNKITRISQDNVPSFRILRKVAKALTRATYNKETLETALREKRLPKGLSPSKIPLKIPDVSIKTQLAWESAHVELNKTLTNILKNHWEERCKLLAEDYEKTLKGIRNRSKPEEVQFILNLILQYQTETVTALDARTAKKIQAQKKMATKEKAVEKESGQEPDSESVQP